MVRLLGAFRRERNGLVADTMHYDGERYGLNYGVSLATVRRIVREVEPNRDEDFARFLAAQQVRCLQLAAWHLADPAAWHEEEALTWLRKVTNSELAEEAAYALWSRTEWLHRLVEEQLTEGAFYPCYALLMAAARLDEPPVSYLESSLTLLERFDHRLMRQAVTALWAQTANRTPNGKEVVLARLATLGTTPAMCFLREELAWRIL